jgi:hypothetical protein
MSELKEEQMQGSGLRRRAGWLGLAGCLLAVGVALAPAAAGANTYNVTACNDAPGSVNHSWATYSDSPTATIAVGQGCPSAGYQPGDQNNTNHGLFARYVANSLDPNNAFAGWAFDAPPGNSISSLTVSDWYTRANSGQYAMLLSEFGALEGCWENNSTLCGNVLGPHTLAVGGAKHLATEVGCHNLSGCRDNGYGTGGLLTMYGATVTVNDLTQPSVSASGPFWTGAWQGGTHAVTISGSDGGDGIQRNDLKIDGSNVIVGGQHGCDYTYARPCADQADTYSYDTHQLSDGAHAVQAVTWDAGWLSGVENGTIYVDNHAPDMSAVDVAVAQGSDWRPANGFDMSWTTPGGQAAPIVKAHYSVCQAASPSSCPVADGQVSGPGVHSISGLNLPAAGDYVVRVWLEDAAGNANKGLAALPVHVRYDPTVPGLAEPAHRNGWLNDDEAEGYPQVIDLRQGAVVGPSGVKGYSVTTDGSTPDNTVEAAGNRATLVINDLPEGRNVVKARAVSGAGVASDQVGQTEVDVDRSKPVVSVSGNPDPGVWQRGPVTLEIRGVDQVGLSGMQGYKEELGQSVRDGAYLETRLDGRESTLIPGDNVEGIVDKHSPLTVSSDGHHAFTFKAVDRAGNESAEKTVDFKVDQTAPELVAFEAQDPVHPATMRVAVSDRTSGVASGVVEMRRQGASSWSTLPTHLAGDHLVATVDDAQLAPGPYEFQARVRDVAGNQAVSNRRRDGSAEVLVAPFRFGTQMAVGIVKQRKVKKVSAKCRHSKRCMAKVRKQRAAQRRKPLTGTVSTLTIPYGKSALVKGTLLTGERQPVASTPVDVYQQLDARGQQMVRIATLRTDRGGRFDYHAPKGPSRTIRFRFDGTETLHPATAQVKLRVPGYSSLRVSRRSVLNGHSVRFTGRIAKPVVDGLKIMDLQVFFRHRWRTFGTPRVSRKGNWKFRYRFEATSGVVTYRFRVRIRREASYPYRLGYSKQVRVTVRGR